MEYEEKVKKIAAEVEAAGPNIKQFLFDIVAIPSMDGQIREVGERIGEEMDVLGFDEVWFDKMGNIVGKIGDGERVLLYDSHIDTVGIGDPGAWEWDPFEGKVEDGYFYARGACDEKGSTPGMVYGLAMAKRLGLLEGITAYYYGNMEEWCDGIAPNALVEEHGITPESVVIGEPTNLRVYRGHKGRVEMKIVAKGRSAHAASSELGDNALYKMLPIIAGVRDLDGSLERHAFLGEGRITVTDMNLQTPSINAVPDEVTIYIDRRLTFGESKEDAIAQVAALIPEADCESVAVKILQYDEPSYTGFVFPVEKYFPAWMMEVNDGVVQAGLKTAEWALGKAAPTGKWNFSTNGNYWRGKAGIPCIGFAPGDERDAHMVTEKVSIAEVIEATRFYALFPAVWIAL
jgi:putative selenium metabolism hydrolase